MCLIPFLCPLHGMFLYMCLCCAWRSARSWKDAQLDADTCVWSGLSRLKKQTNPSIYIYIVYMHNVFRYVSCVFNFEWVLWSLCRICSTRNSVYLPLPRKVKGREKKWNQRKGTWKGISFQNWSSAHCKYILLWSQPRMACSNCPSFQHSHLIETIQIRIAMKPTSHGLF